MIAKFVSGCFVATCSYVIIHSMSNIYSYVNLQFTVHILYIYICWRKDSIIQLQRRWSVIKLYWSTKIYNVSLLTATYSYKIKNAFTNVELNILKSDVNWFLILCNNYLHETAIEISIIFSVKTYNNL